MSAPVVASVEDLGPLDRPQNVIRDGGTSCKIGPEKMAWFFGDTMISGHFSDNSWAVARLDSPRTLEPIEPVTNQLIPHSPAEAAWNAVHDTTKDRYAVWPSTAVMRADGQVAIGYEVVHIQPSGWISDRVGVALWRPGEPQARRKDTFINTDLVPEWPHGWSWLTPSQDGAATFFYCLSKDEGDWLSRSAMAARAPTRRLGQPSAYRFWNGAKWVPDVDEAIYVLPGSAGAAAQFSVAYNGYLRQWLGVFMTIGSEAKAVTAPTPRGPWSEPIDLFTGRPPKEGSFDYSLIQHRELAEEAGRVIYLSYAHPIAEWDADMPLVRVRFA